MHWIKTIIFIVLMVMQQSIFATAPPVTTCHTATQIRAIYEHCGLEGQLCYEAFKKSIEGYDRYQPAKHIVAICDFSKPSNLKRFFVIDIDQLKTLTCTYVAHGKNSGELVAKAFSNQPESLKTSLGFYKIGAPIETTKHGKSLLLDGLEQGINDNARRREIIIHAASYVGEKFVKQYGYTGKSFGCPALPEEVLKMLMPILSNGSLLYIYSK